MMRSPFKESPRMTCYFKKPGKWSAGYHTGEDWVCDTDKILVSPSDGMILKSKYDTSYGNHVIIRTTDAKVILMAHMKNTPLVKQGQTVKAGQSIGIMGNTGNSFGAHLHIEVQNSKSWSYNRNLLKPSSYIDFNDFEKKDKEDEEMRYKTIKDVPEVYRKAVQRRIDNGTLKGDGKGNINVYESAAWQWTIDDRQRYQTIDDIPDWGMDTIVKLMSKKLLQGDSKGNLDLTHDALRQYVINDRAGVYR